MLFTVVIASRLHRHKIAAFRHSIALYRHNIAHHFWKPA
ncbi:hypothetical protein PT7_1782 [Pusillimonas sp. T7-7]|nr:hypothetical protein PT7_1782 [Pusillimonas sp. T7-7]